MRDGKKRFIPKNRGKNMIVGVIYDDITLV